ISARRSPSDVRFLAARSSFARRSLSNALPGFAWTASSKARRAARSRSLSALTIKLQRVVLRDREAGAPRWHLDAREHRSDSERRPAAQFRRHVRHVIEENLAALDLLAEGGDLLVVDAGHEQVALRDAFAESVVQFTAAVVELDGRAADPRVRG